MIWASGMCVCVRINTRAPLWGQCWATCWQLSPKRNVGICFLMQQTLVKVTDFTAQSVGSLSISHQETSHSLHRSSVQFLVPELCWCSWTTSQRCKVLHVRIFHCSIFGTPSWVLILYLLLLSLHYQAADKLWMVLKDTVLEMTFVKIRGLYLKVG